MNFDSSFDRVMIERIWINSSFLMELLTEEGVVSKECVVSSFKTIRVIIVASIVVKNLIVIVVMGLWQFVDLSADFYQIIRFGIWIAGNFLEELVKRISAILKCRM